MRLSSTGGGNLATKLKGVSRSAERAIQGLEAGSLDHMKTASYNLITPVKNEERYLPGLAQCIIKQSHLPEVWVIIDDASTDRTPEIIKELVDTHAWIHAIRIEEHKERTFGAHLFGIFRTGLERSVELSGEVEYLVNLDADVRFHDETIRLLCGVMDTNHKLAIASPRLMTLRQETDVEELKHPETILADKKLVLRTDKNRVNEPTNGLRIYRKQFLDAIGGFPVNDAADDMVLGKAVMKGYSIGFVDGIWAYLIRETGTTLKNAYARGKVRGYRLYIVHYHPLLAAAAFAWDTLFRPSWGAGVLAGYLEALIKRKKRIDDPDVISYYRKERFRKVSEFAKSQARRKPPRGVKG